VKFLCLLAALKHQIAYDILKLSCHCSFSRNEAGANRVLASCWKRPRWPKTAFV